MTINLHQRLQILLLTQFPQNQCNQLNYSEFSLPVVTACKFQPDHPRFTVVRGVHYYVITDFFLFLPQLVFRYQKLANTEFQIVGVNFFRGRRFSVSDFRGWGGWLIGGFEFFGGFKFFWSEFVVLSFRVFVFRTFRVFWTWVFRFYRRARTCRRSRWFQRVS